MLYYPGFPLWHNTVSKERLERVKEMAAGEPPITRTDLREELRHYATKEDLAELKGDLKIDMARLETRLTRWLVGSIAVVGTVVAIVDKL